MKKLVIQDLTPIMMMVTDRCRYGTDDEQQRIERLIEDAGRAARAGVELIQVRERRLDDRALLTLVHRVAGEVGPRARVLVNRRTDIALAASVDGVHLPGDAPPASRVRELLPSGALVGRSVHSVEEAVAAERDGGCDYLTFGTVYPSIGKPSGHVAAGGAALRAVCQAVRLPVLAIGGINPERARAVADAGAFGVAAIGMFVTSTASGDAEREMRESVAAVRAAFDPGGQRPLQ